MRSHVLTKARACQALLKMKATMRLVSLLLLTCVSVKTDSQERTARQVGSSDKIAVLL